MNNQNRKNPVLFIICLGLVTSAFSLLTIYGSNNGETSILCFYLNYFPIGALLMGGIAGIGYAAGSYFQRYKVPIKFVVLIFIIQIVVYFIGDYITFKEFSKKNLTIARFSYPEYFTDRVENIGFKSEKAKEIRPLGTHGYFVEFAAVMGFALGSLIGVFILRAMKYCDACNNYMKQYILVYLPAAVSSNKLAREYDSNRKQFEEDCNKVLQKAMDKCVEIMKKTESGYTKDDIWKALYDFKAANYVENREIKTWLIIDMYGCKSCKNFDLEIKMGHVKNGNVVNTISIFHFLKNNGELDDILKIKRIELNHSKIES